MEHLAPVGWADVATKHDLDQLKGQLEGRIDSIGARIEVTEQRLLATFRAEINAQTRIMIFSMATVLLGVAGLALTASGL